MEAMSNLILFDALKAKKKSKPMVKRRTFSEKLPENIVVTSTTTDAIHIIILSLVKVQKHVREHLAHGKALNERNKKVTKTSFFFSFGKL